MTSETFEVDFASLRPVDEAVARVALNDELVFGSGSEVMSKSPAEKAYDIRRELEISALVWLSRRYGSSEYDLESMVSEIGEWRDELLAREEADSIREFATRAVQRGDHEPEEVETIIYLHEERKAYIEGA